MKFLKITFMAIVFSMQDLVGASSSCQGLSDIYPQCKDIASNCLSNRAQMDAMCAKTCCEANKDIPLVARYVPCQELSDSYPQCKDYASYCESHREQLEAACAKTCCEEKIVENKDESGSDVQQKEDCEGKVDHGRYCDEQLGFCEYDPDHRNNVCALACCKERIREASVVSLKRCRGQKNYIDYCNVDDCDYHRAFMQANCKFACCEAEVLKRRCGDKKNWRKHCYELVESGWCYHQRSFMSTNCPKACCEDEVRSEKHY